MHRGRRVKRKSSSNVNRLIVSHGLFSLFANPVRYVLTLSVGCIALGAFWIVQALQLMLTGEVAAYTALWGVSFVILGLVFFVLGVVVRQGNMIQRELWKLQRFHLDPGTERRSLVDRERAE